MDKLRLTLIQSSLHWENKEKNLEMFSEKISRLSNSTDLIILPEMFTTGFSMRPEIFAESMNGTTVEWMREKALENKCAITGSFICSENGNYYNRLIWMRSDGSYSTYDKRHLFSMGDENNHYTAGTEKIVEKIKGWRICPLICYDLRFPVWSRNTGNYDLLIYVANWPERRTHPWKTLLPARAIENQCYVVGLNRIGKDGNEIHHSGDSAVINAKGEIISDISTNEEAVSTVSIDLQELVEFRKVFPVLNDADEFELKA
jgi:omega-amidase